MSLAAGVNLKMWEGPNNFLDLNLFKLLRKRASFLISREQMSGGLVKGSSEQHGFSGSGCCLFRAIKEQGVAGYFLSPCDIWCLSQWIGATLNLSRALVDRTSIDGGNSLHHESPFSVYCSVAVNLHWTACLVLPCCKIGKQKLSLSPVTIHTMFRAPGSIDSSESTWCPTRPRCTHAHPDQLNIGWSLKQLLVMTCFVTGNHCKTLASRDWKWLFCSEK